MREGDNNTDAVYVQTLQSLAKNINPTFQSMMKRVLGPVLEQIKAKDEDAGIHEGPVKSMTRMVSKLNEYVDEYTNDDGTTNQGKRFPRAACIIDVVRLSVAFDS